METSVSTVVVVIGGSAVLKGAVKAASRKLPAAEMVCTDVPGAPTAVASRWPFAVVVSSELYAFDPSEFEALARDVAAVLVVAEEDLSAAEQQSVMELQLVAALRSGNS